MEKETNGNSLFWKAIGSFFKTIPAVNIGISQDPDGTTVRWEKMMIQIDDYRVTIITEKVVEDLQQMIDDAIAEENYELAMQLKERLNKPPKDESI